MSVPVAVFAFRRPAMLQQLLMDLQTNEGAAQTPLYVFSDAGRNRVERAVVAQVRGLCREVAGFESVTLMARENNLGCARNVIDGVSSLLRDFPAVIVLEEDLRVSPWLLGFLRRALGLYSGRKDIFSVSAFAPPPQLVGMPVDYGHDVYLSHRNASWGWATWANRWRQVDWAVGDYSAFQVDRRRRRAFDRGGNDLSLMLDAQMAGRIDSWSIRFSYAHFTHHAYSLCPRWSYTDHVGDDGSGTHVPAGRGLRVDLSRALAQPELPADLQPDDAVLNALSGYFGEPWLSAMLGRMPGVRPLVCALKQRLGIRGPLF